MVTGPTRGDLGRGAGQGGECRGWVYRPERAPEDFLWGAGLPHRPGECGSRGEHGAGPGEDPWAIRVCCGVRHVIVPALEDCTSDLWRGSLAVSRGGGGVVVRGVEDTGAKGGIAIGCGGALPFLWAV